MNNNEIFINNLKKNIINYNIERITAHCTRGGRIIKNTCKKMAKTIKRIRHMGLIKNCKSPKSNNISQQTNTNNINTTKAEIK